MKCGEFNPIHFHGDDISFVIYVSLPDEILKEKNEFTDRGTGPGWISFYYGEHSDSYKSLYDFFSSIASTFNSTI